MKKKKENDTLELISIFRGSHHVNPTRKSVLSLEILKSLYKLKTTTFTTLLKFKSGWSPSKDYTLVLSKVNGNQTCATASLNSSTVTHSPTGYSVINGSDLRLLSLSCRPYFESRACFFLAPLNARPFITS